MKYLDLSRSITGSALLGFHQGHLRAPIQECSTWTGSGLAEISVTSVRESLGGLKPVMILLWSDLSRRCGHKSLHSSMRADVKEGPGHAT